MASATPATMSKPGVLLALSGGVDSSVALRLLQEQGYDVQAAVFEFSPAHKRAVTAAQSAADALGVTLHVVRCHDAFYRQVITPFAKSYKKGQTPNPCIICNPLLKFARLRALADELGLSFIATGHYAGIVKQGGRYLIKKAAFLPRDQSYMLYRLTQRQLEGLLLPLSALSKDEVRKKAFDLSLPCANAPDSQEICFIEDNDYPAYIERHFGPSKPGVFLSPEGVVCGAHKGVLHYTVGQRKGLGIALGRPVFIKRIDALTGNIYLAERGEEFSCALILSDCVWLPFSAPAGEILVQAKIRSQAKGAGAAVAPLSANRATVVFDEPQRAPAPGQSCVFYQGDLLIGGGLIEQVS